MYPGPSSRGQRVSLPNLSVLLLFQKASKMSASETCRIAILLPDGVNGDCQEIARSLGATVVEASEPAEVIVAVSVAGPNFLVGFTEMLC